MTTNWLQSISKLNSIKELHLVELTISNWLWLSFHHFLELLCFSTVSASGVAIGDGWQALVAYINLACYYVFSLPFGYILGYAANLGVVGIWGGMIAGIALQTLLLLLVLYKTNWNKEVEQTIERMRKWGGQDIATESLASKQTSFQSDA